MLFLAAALVGTLGGRLSGGSFQNLATIRFRWPFVVLAALLVKEAGVITPLGKLGFAPFLYGLALAALIGWTLWHIERLPGVWLVAAGAASNLLVVAVNGGHMPVSPELAASGPRELLTKGVLGQYVLASDSTHLNWLGDWIAFPALLGRLFPHAYSPGDLLVAVGMFEVLFLVVGGWTRVLPERAAPVAPAASVTQPSTTNADTAAPNGAQPEPMLSEDDISKTRGLSQATMLERQKTRRWPFGPKPSEAEQGSEQTPDMLL